MVERGGTRRSFLGALAVTAGGAVAGCRSPGAVFQNEETPTDDAPTASTGGGTGESSSYTDVYQDVIDSVASVRIYGADGQRGQGSAFVYDDQYLVTNAHVVDGSRRVAVRFESTGWIPAETVASDTYSDLAVVEPDEISGPAEPLSFVEEEPPVGTEVVAIGNPFGFSGSVSTGVVSGTDRNLSGPNDFSIPDAVQTDAPVNPGNSGGPLVTLDGDVVGVVNAGGGDNLGFAVSAALTQRVVPSLIATGGYRHSYMGVLLQDVSPVIAEANDLANAAGVYIHEVRDGGPSDGVLQGSTDETTVEGVETPVGGDVIRTMDGEPIPTRQALSTVLALRTTPGDSVSVALQRDGEPVDVDLVLGSRPEP